MFTPNCAVCGSKRSWFIKGQEVRGLLHNLTGIKVPIINALLKANLQCFTYSACRTFTKNKE